MILLSSLLSMCFFDVVYDFTTRSYFNVIFLRGDRSGDFMEALLYMQY